MESDLKISVTKFEPGNFSDGATEFVKRAKNAALSFPPWYEIGAAKYREMSAGGKTPFPLPKLLKEGQVIHLASREAGRSIPCRLIYPSIFSDSDSHEKLQPRGVIMHLHGGGWVFMSHLSSDSQLQAYANASECVVVSVGFRLAPEHPFPAGVEDCIDCAVALCDRAETDFGGPLKFFIGESTGAHLSLLTLFYLLDERPRFSLLGGLVLNYGWFDLSLLPSSMANPNAPILSLKSMEEYLEAFTPGLTAGDRKASHISPLYVDLHKFGTRLPATLLTCGTLDALLDNTILMASRWAITGAPTVVRFFAGACHGLLSQPTQEAQECLSDISSWLRERNAHTM